MSVLFRNLRPIVPFDVNNADHRRYYTEFVQNRTWGHCPVKFMTESLDQDLVSFINEKMLNYYIQREFKNEAHKVTGKKSATPKAKTTLRVVRSKQPVSP